MGMFSNDVKPKIVCGESRTKQSFKDKVNINSILARHRKSGMLTHVNKNAPFYGDVSMFENYHDALNKVHLAQKLFMNMSSDIRKRFQNDPGQMIEFLEDPNNRPEAVKLGMILADPKESEPKAPEPKGGEPTPPKV